MNDRERRGEREIPTQKANTLKLICSIVKQKHAKKAHKFHVKQTANETIRVRILHSAGFFSYPFLFLQSCSDFSPFALPIRCNLQLFCLSDLPFIYFDIW